jgi:hypothetical protein
MVGNVARLEQAVRKLEDAHKGAEEPDEGLENRPRLRDEMFYGLPGEFAREACRNSEAAPAPVALMLLTFIGAMAGRGPYLRVGDVTHHARVFALHVAGTNAGKGESRELLRRVIEAIRKGKVAGADAALLGKMHTGGLSTKEGIAAAIPDRVEKDGKVILEGTADKRLLVFESEFANVLRVMRREGNLLSTALRDAWDGVSIGSLTKNDPMHATAPHVALWASITPAELNAQLAEVDTQNGFLNRFLVFHAESERDVPWPQPVPEGTVQRFAEQIVEIITWARDRYPAEADTLELTLSPDAQAAHERAYGRLKRLSPDPKLGALLSRARSQVLRLAMLFAITDRTATVSEAHYKAAFAWIDYATQSVRYVFRRGGAELKASQASERADKILDALKERPDGRLSRTEISRLFAGHATRGEIEQALKALLERNPCPIRVSRERVQKDGSTARTEYVGLAARSAT